MTQQESLQNPYVCPDMYESKAYLYVHITPNKSKQSPFSFWKSGPQKGLLLGPDFCCFFCWLTTLNPPPPDGPVVKRHLASYAVVQQIESYLIWVENFHLLLEMKEVELIHHHKKCGKNCTN